MSKAAQGFSLRRTDRTPQTDSLQAAGANPRRTPLIVKRAICGWKLSSFWIGKQGNFYIKMRKSCYSFRVISGINTITL